MRIRITIPMKVTMMNDDIVDDLLLLFLFAFIYYIYIDLTLIWLDISKNF